MRVFAKTCAAAGLVAAVVAGSVLTAGSASAETDGIVAVQGTCGDKFSPSVRGGSAAWTITCTGGRVVVDGWVKDTKADGKAAEVYGTWEGGADFKTVRAGGNGKRVTFDRSHKGSHVYLYLRVV